MMAPAISFLVQILVCLSLCPFPSSLMPMSYRPVLLLYPFLSPSSFLFTLSVSLTLIILHPSSPRSSSLLFQFPYSYISLSLSLYLLYLSFLCPSISHSCSYSHNLRRSIIHFYYITSLYYKRYYITSSYYTLQVLVISIHITLTTHVLILKGNPIWTWAVVQMRMRREKTCPQYRVSYQ